MNNHGGQTLDRLAKRGGLSACEAIAVLEGRNWKPMDDEAARAQIEAMASAYSPNAEVRDPAT